MIKVREVGKTQTTVKVADISANDLITFVTGHGYADMDVEVDYHFFDERHFGDITYVYGQLHGELDIFTVITNYIVRYAEGKGVFQIEYIDFKDEIFTVEYITIRKV